MSASDHKKKIRLVRERFAMPKDEYAAIDQLKTRATAMGTSVKKSELLRAGLMALMQLNDAAYKRALAAVPRRRKGRAPTDLLGSDEVAPARKRAVSKKSADVPAAPVHLQAKLTAPGRPTQVRTEKPRKSRAATQG